MADMTIAGLAREGGVGVETVRYYQRRGLLPTPVRVAAQGGRPAVRRYDAADVTRLRFIRAAQAGGFTLDEIAELLELDAGQDRDRARGLALDRISALDAKISALQTAREGLRRLATACEAGGAGPCLILAAFDPDAASR